MDKRTIIITMLMIFTHWRCENRWASDRSNQDDFYTITGGWDWIRVPLIKPYEVKKVDPEIKSNQWGVAFERITGATNVRKVGVSDSVIYLLCGDSTLFEYKYLKAAWFIMDTKTKTEKGFAREEDFKSYIEENHYPLPQWHDLDSLSVALANGGRVPWIPK